MGKAHEPFFRFEKGGCVGGGLFQQTGEDGLKIIVDRDLAQIVDEPRDKSKLGFVMTAMGTELFRDEAGCQGMEPEFIAPEPVVFIRLGRQVDEREARQQIVRFRYPSRTTASCTSVTLLPRLA